MLSSWLGTMIKFSMELLFILCITSQKLKYSSATKTGQNSTGIRSTVGQAGRIGLPLDGTLTSVVRAFNLIHRWEEAAHSTKSYECYRSELRWMGLGLPKERARRASLNPQLKQPVTTTYCGFCVLLLRCITCDLRMGLLWIASLLNTGGF